MLLENTPAVLSLGTLCEEFGHSYHRTSGPKPHLIKNVKKLHCDTSNCVPFVFHGLSTSSSTPSSSTSPTSASKDTGLPRKCQQQKEVRVWVSHYGETRRPVARGARLATGVQAWTGWWKCSRTSGHFQFFSWITFGAASKSGTELTWHVYSHPERRELRYPFEDENYEGFLQKTHRYSGAQSGKFWWFKNCCSQSSECRMWISKNHRYAVVVQDLAIQWVQPYPVQNKNFSGNTQELAKVLGAR